MRTIAQADLIRIPLERDENGNEITPSLEQLLKEGSRRKPLPEKGDGEACDVQSIGLISDRELSAREIGEYRRDHRAIENCLHHVLDEDRGSVRKLPNHTDRSHG